MRRLIYKLLRLYWRVFRPITLGTRVLVVRDEQVLLVRMTYVTGWHLPGGAVDRGESFFDGALRELREECGLEPLDPHEVRLLGLYFNSNHGNSNHVALYSMGACREIAGAKRDPEIAEIRFFPLREIPPETTPATRRRVQDYLNGKFETTQW